MLYNVGVHPYQNFNLKRVLDDDHDYKFAEHLVVSPGMVDLMQYTGLKDKNGKDIYEGDVVRHIPSAFDTEEAQGEIYWFNGHQRFAMRTNGYQHYLDSLNTYEIIGNIYKNPELTTK